MDGDFSMITHVRKQLRPRFHSLCQIQVIRRSNTKEAAKMIVYSLFCYWIDYCSAVYVVLPRSPTNDLDSVLHAAARMISGLSKYDRITSVLRYDLHLLSLQQRVIYKLSLTTYKEINGTHRAASRPCACLRQQMRLVYAYALPIHVIYFSR